ncbi:3-oxoacyl-[acyl-carrier-protein] synthase [Granulibacter bethesdensis CGDNIH4]|nr:3-oxoacyl-[acyl-carrier-protein] synthase [Granulibacter bethesdensis CGDNIH4]
MALSAHLCWPSSWPVHKIRVRLPFPSHPRMDDTATMQPLGITSTSLVSAIGRDEQTTLQALLTRQSGLRRCDMFGITEGWIGRVEGLEEYSLPSALARFDCRNHRLADMALHSDGFSDHVARARARYGAERIAVVLGTSTSGILTSEEAYRCRAPGEKLPDDLDVENTHDLFALARFVQARLQLEGPAFVISTACASAAKAFADAQQLIASGLCDAAVVGGADTLCRMTLRGFAALELISPDATQPGDAGRRGISIGEAAGFALLERDEAPAMLLGHGASSDGHHMSAPHPEGRGATDAMRGALRSAGLSPDAIDFVALHGTGTRQNDAMEDRAITEIFGTQTPCGSSKGWMGHTLGTAGMVGVALAMLSLKHGFLPGNINVSQVDPTFTARLLTENLVASPRRILINAFGFGGINCSLLVGQP